MLRLSPRGVTGLVVASLRRDERGTIAIVFALSMLVISCLLGVALDYGNAYRVRSMLQSMADAATLSVVATKSDGYAAAAAMTSDGEVPAAQASALAMLTAEVSGKLGKAHLTSTASVTKSGSRVTATVDYTVDVPTTFLALLNLKHVTVSGSAKSMNRLPSYMDFYLLLDNSPSMGVAATPGDIDTMVNNTADACAFACHDTTGVADYYTLAHQLGVTMRIDVLRQATESLMDTALAEEMVPNEFRMDISTFNTGLQSIASLTPNLGAAKSSASAIDLMSVAGQNTNNDRYTDYGATLTAIDNLVPASGSGTRPNDPQRVVFFVTDGVADQVESTATSVVGNASMSVAGQDRLIQTIDPALCEDLKSRGIKVAVLYTTYLPLPTNAFYTTNVEPWADQINPQMQSCASPGLFFEVSPSEGIAEALKALFVKVVTNARVSS